MNVFQFAPRAGVPFDPDSVANQVRRFNLRAGAAYQSTDNSGALSVADDDPVGCVVDKLGGYPNRLLAGNSTTQRPVLKTTGGPNGQRFLRFATTNTMLEGFTLNQPCTRFDVIRLTAGWTVGNYLIGGYSIVNGLLQPFPSGKLRLYSGTAGPEAAISADTWMVVTQVFNGASSAIRINLGTEVTSGDVGSGNPAGYQLNDLTYPVAFDWVEGIMHSGVVSGGDRTSIISFLMTFYGIS